MSITFEVNSESLLQVTAKENSTGREVSSTFSTRETPEAVKARMAQDHPSESPPTASAPTAQGLARCSHAPSPAREEGGRRGWLKGLFGRR